MASISSSCRRCSLGNVAVASTPQLLQQQYPQQYGGYDSGGDSSGNAQGQVPLTGPPKKHSSASLVNTRAYWPYPSAAAIAAATGAECQSPGACSSSLEFEAMAAVHRLSVAVRDISVSEMLPRTPQLIFVNVTTLEGQPYCLELTAKGWRITSLRTDCMQGDFTRMELFTVYYESVYDLMSVISPSFKQHAAALASSRKSRSSCDEDYDSDAVAAANANGNDALDAFYDLSKPGSNAASRRQSLTPAGGVAAVSGAGSRRPSLKHSATEPHVIQLCPQCSCVSLVTPAGESIADVLLDSEPPVAATAATTTETPTQIVHAATCAALPAVEGGAGASTCRCGALSHRVGGSGLVDEALKFPRRKLRNISEGVAKTDGDDDAELDVDTSSSDELKFTANSTTAASGASGAARLPGRASRSSSHSTSTQPSSSSASSSRRTSHSPRSD